MTKEEYRKASHFRDATKRVAAPGSQSGLFDYAPLFRVCFLCRSQWPTRDWNPVHKARSRQKSFVAAFLLVTHP